MTSALDIGDARTLKTAVSMVLGSFCGRFCVPRPLVLDACQFCFTIALEGTSALDIARTLKTAVV